MGYPVANPAQNKDTTPAVGNGEHGEINLGSEEGLIACGAKK